MGTVLIPATTGTSYDVFGTAAELATYAAGSFTFAATYAAAAVDDVSRAHVEATRLIARLSFLDEADAVPATASAAVATACYELVLAALVDAAVLARDSTGSNVRRIEAKGVAVENFAPVAGARFPLRVMALLGPLLGGSVASGSAGSYAAGTSTASDFDECDRYGVTGAS